MLEVLSTVIPVFGLIATGILLGRTRFFSANFARDFANFSFNVAMPALIFHATLRAGALPSSPILLLVVFFLGTAITWSSAILVGRSLLRLTGPDLPPFAIASCFGNTVMLGLPIAILAYGPEATVPISIILLFEAPLLWFVGILHAEWSGRAGQLSPGRALREALLVLVANPVIAAILAGVAMRQLGLTLPAMADGVVALLGQAAVPTSLVALGFAVSRMQLRGRMGTIGAIGWLKLVVYPAAVWILAGLFGLPPVWAGTIVLVAAMPSGANAFLFAVRYDRLADTVSGAVAITTLVSVLTSTALLMLLVPELS